MPDDLIDIPVLDDWIGDQLPDGGASLTATRLGAGTGIANALYILQRGELQWVLRRPPAVKNDPSASNTLREWRILQALEGTAVPHPTPRLLCEDLGVLGSTFMIMDVVDGFTPGFELNETNGTVALTYEIGASGTTSAVNLIPELVISE